VSFQQSLVLFPFDGDLRVEFFGFIQELRHAVF
jgi:hypothetical protein